jgi:hypothetical protein
MHFSRLVSSACLSLGLAACGLDDLPAGQNFATGAGGRGSGPASSAGGAAGAAGAATSGTQATGGASTSSTTSAGGTGSPAAGGGAGSSTTGGGTGPAGGAGGSGGSDPAAPDGSSGEASSVDAPGDANVLACPGHALELDGIGYLQVARMVQDDFTLEAWIKTITSFSGTNFYEGNGLFYADVAGTANDFGTSILSGKFAFGVGNPDTTITSTTMVTTGQWVHVAATRRMSTGEIQVLVNGHVESSMTVAQTQSLSAQSLMTIGANSIDGKYFNGVVDELRIWNIVRSEADIAGTMHTTLTGTEAGLVAYYRLDDAVGSSVATDSSPSHADATLSGEGTFIVSDAPACP